MIEIDGEKKKKGKKKCVKVTNCQYHLTGLTNIDF